MPQAKITNLSKIIGIMGLLGVSQLWGQDAPQGVTIQNVSVLGSGCSPESVASVLSPDAKEVSLLFDNFSAEATAGSGPLVGKKFCQLALQISIPPGWQMGLTSADYRGFVSIDPGALAQHEVLYSFNKSFSGNFRSRVLNGPLNQDYSFRNEIAPNLINWSDCHTRNVELNIRVSLVAQGNSAGGAMITLDTVDGAIQQSFQVAWRTCQGRPVDPRPNPRPNPQPNPRPNPQPQPGNPVTNQLEIFQMFDGVTRFLTPDPRLVEGGAWVNQGLIFTAFRQATREFNPQPIYQCQYLQNRRYFVTTDGRCEGQKLERQLGFIAQRQIGNSVALYALLNAQDPTDRAVTINPAQYPHMQSSGIIGYVLSGPSQPAGGRLGR
jgi:hypothetical protein